MQVLIQPGSHLENISEPKLVKEKAFISLFRRKMQPGKSSSFIAFQLILTSALQILERKVSRVFNERGIHNLLWKKKKGVGGGGGPIN